MLDKIFSKIERFVPEKWRWILNHDGFKRYFANTGWMFFGQMFSLLVSFFIGAWLARYLGPTKYGIFSYAIAFTGLFSFIASLGVDGILSRELVDKSDNKDKLLGTGFIIELVGGLLAFLIVFISSFVFEDRALVRQLIIIYSLIFIISPINIINVFFQSQVKAKINSKIKIYTLVISSVLKILLILLGGGVIWLTWIFFFDFLFNCIFLVYYYTKTGFNIFSWKYDYKLAKKILSGSLFLILAMAANYIFLRADQVMIGAMLGEREVGLYAVAVKFVEVWYFIPVIICSSLFPAIINSKKINELVYRKRLKGFFIMLFLIGIFISIFTAIISPLVIKIIFGIDYLESINIAVIYAWSNIGLFLGWGMYHYFLSENKLKNIFYFYFVSMVMNIFLNFILINKMGLTGAAYSTLISYSIPPLFVFIFNKFKYDAKNIG
ncbi:MAG: flippase [Patescibacteria group bacterium]